MMKKYIYYLIVFGCAFFLNNVQLLMALNPDRYASESILKTGKWIKLKVTNNGIYKLSYDEIHKLGMDPSKVKIYGYGGWVLNEDFSKTEEYIDDLPEVSVYINKGSDGVFSSGDYLLFYGRGITKWSYDGSEYIHENNPYATHGCYFLTEDDSGPQEMKVEQSVSGSVQTIEIYDDYALHEQDLDRAPEVNTGRELFGESFTGSRTKLPLSFYVPGITSDNGYARLSFAAKASSTTPVSLDIDGVTIVNTHITGVGEQYVKGSLANQRGIWSGEKNERFTVNVNYNAGNQAFASLDYVRLNFCRELRSYGEAYTFFRNKSSMGKTVTYIIKNATSNMLVFDVTDNHAAKMMATEFSGGELRFSASSASGELREFVLVDPSKTGFDEVVSLGEVPNQDLHSLSQTDMVIITPKLFENYAQQLAEEHRQRDGLRVTVALSDEIYNEFSSGVYDITAYRRFLKMFYDRAETEDDKPKYLLLFGDGVFDNRMLSEACRGWNRDNFLLTYQVKESLNEHNSYGTEDYLGYLDDIKPTFTSGNPALKQLRLGIGRFPVRSLEQADIVITKLINYMDNKNPGSWKNRLVFSADDTGTKETFVLHTNQANKLADSVEATFPEYMVSKVFMDAYKKSLSNGRTTYPEAKQKLNDLFKKGCFLFNYTGHGSVTDLSAENMVGVSDINLMNFTDLPLWITATCDYSWFDAISTSAGEMVFLHKKSGGIALISTTRVVGSTENYNLNVKLVNNLFQRDEQGQYPRLGDILRKSKNELGGTNQLNYILLGDPALRLNYPEEQIVLREINGEPLKEGKIYEFKAMEKITISGDILDFSGNVNTGFNGSLRTTVFDAQDNLKTVLKNSDNESYEFTEYAKTVFIGNDSVKEGKFSTTFMVPLDISYSDNQGKINFYASDTEKKLEANGYFSEYRLNGTSEGIYDDTKGPDILSMYLNSTSFNSGDVVNSTPYFIAEVYDENGINMSGSSIGHDIMLMIDNSPVTSYNLNAYYEPSSEVYGGGVVRFSIPSLPDGKHQLVFRVWDLLNNASTDTLDFYVDSGLKPEIYDLTATNNPAREETYFLLSSNRPESQVDIDIYIYDMTGSRVWTYTEQGIIGDWLEDYTIHWNLCSDKGSRIRPGVYIYKAMISSENSKEATKAKKIIILGQ